MPYVTRDDTGAINGVFTNAQEFAQEYLADNDPGVLAFSTPVPEAPPSEGAPPVNDTPSIQDQINALAARLAAVEKKVA